MDTAFGVSGGDWSNLSSIVNVEEADRERGSGG